MYVAISALSVKPDRTGGGETVLRNLVHHLPLADPGIRYLIFVTQENQSLFAEHGSALTLRVVPNWVCSPANRVLYELLVLPWVVRQRGVDLYFSINQVASPLLPCPTIAFVQNLLYYHYRDFFRFSGSRLTAWMGAELRNLYYSSLQGISVRRAVHTIAVSENVRQEVARRENIPLAKITTIPLAVATKNTAPLPGLTANPTGARSPGTKPFFLMVGALSPYKNIDRAMAGLARLRKENPSRDLELVLLGLNSHGYEHHLRGVAAGLGIAHAVHFMGYVPHDQLGMWYQQARAFLLLSACEAFPLPPLEAMAWGTPVIASNLSSVPEVVGEGAVIVDPYDTAQVADALGKMTDDNHFRRTQIASGYRWVQRFSWEQTATRIAALLRLCSQRSR